MAEFAKHTDPFVEMSGYERLAAAVIRKAYEDYVEALKRDMTFGHPGKNRTTVKKLERLMAEEVQHRTSLPYAEARKRLNQLGEDYIPYAKKNAEIQVDTLRRWFHSDQFLIYSKGIDPQCLLDRAQEEAEAWYEEKKKEQRLKRNYMKRGDKEL